jgi:hypothetical protein
VRVLAGELAHQVLPALRQLQHRDQLAPLALGLLDCPGCEPALAPLKIVAPFSRVVPLDRHSHLDRLESSTTWNPARTGACSSASGTLLIVLRSAPW